jgi:uncharacterized protein (DUF1501 family)
MASIRFRTASESSVGLLQAGVPRHLRFARRTLVQAGSIGLLGLGMNHVSALATPKPAAPAANHTPPRSVIFIFQSGGMSQLDSLDLKPQAPDGIRGEFNPIQTRTPGVQICEHLPLLAACSDRWSLIRSLTTPYNEHSQGHMSILSGRTPLPPGFNPNKPQPRDWPAIAAVAGDLVPPRNDNLPPAIVLPEKLIHRTGRVIPGQFGGQMGSLRDPWFVQASPFNATSYGAYPEYGFHFERGLENDPALKFQAPNLSLPQGLTSRQILDRTRLLATLERQRAELDTGAAVEALDGYRQAAVSLLTSSSVQQAFDVHNVDSATQQRYGRNAFGWSLLMARQLVEQGVSLVQVNLGNNESWDTHQNNFPMMRDCLLPPTDRAVSALLNDLAERGLLETTLVVMCGEMGRTPKINGGIGKSKIPGRDHWGAVQSVLIAGGGVPGGVVVGASDEKGAFPADAPQRPENLAATIYNALGIPPAGAWNDEFGRPHRVYHGEPIRFA